VDDKQWLRIGRGCAVFLWMLVIGALLGGPLIGYFLSGSLTFILTFYPAYGFIFLIFLGVAVSIRVGEAKRRLKVDSVFDPIPK
jgi:hypothetical protein